MNGKNTTRRRVLRYGATTGSLAVGGLLITGSASAQQGGVAYLKEQHLRGKNNPDEPRFKIVELCKTTDIEPPCDGTGDRTYAVYKIRCPNHQSGGGAHAEEHGDGCGGGGQGGCGRHILVNPNRNVRIGGLHEFTSVRKCGDGYVKAAFKPA